MKRIITLSIVFILILSTMILPSFANGEESGTIGTVTYTYYSDTKELHFSGGELPESNFDGMGYGNGWDSDFKADVEKIVYDGQVITNDSTFSMFYGYTNLKTIENIDYLDTTGARDMSYMFCDCTSLETLDVSSFNTSEVYNMSFMFSGCESLTSLHLGGSFDTRQTESMYNAFYHVNSLREFTLGENVTHLMADLTAVSQMNGFDPQLYTGKWQNVGSGTVDDPKGDQIVTSEELIVGYDGTHPDTYVWQPIKEIINGWLQVGEQWQYYDNGNMLTGWQEIGGEWYYFNNDGYMQTGWEQIGGSWFYFAGSGEMQTGWQEIGGEWYYFSNSGYMQTGWEQIGGSWFYFASSGEMQTGWQEIRGEWYYFSNSGYMQTGWEQIGGSWFYFASSGEMQTGWQKIGGEWYYFSNSGYMQTGWQQINGRWFYFASSGEMQTGWQQIGGVWYYFYDSGVMATNTVISGWTISSSGVATKMQNNSGSSSVSDSVQKAVLEYIKEVNGYCTMKDMANHTGYSYNKVKYAVQKLKEKGLIYHTTGNSSGHWVVVQ